VTHSIHDLPKNGVYYVIGCGESVVIPQREITEEMHDRRALMKLGPANHLKNGAKAKILRAYTRPRGQELLSVEVSETEVIVTANEDGLRGWALVDVIDDISEPAGTDYEFVVVRLPQLKEAPAAPVVVKATAPAPVEIAEKPAGPKTTEVKTDL
jgi:hypothetical protein